MDARTAESPVKSQTLKWLQRERESGRLYDRAAVVIGIFFVAMLGFSFWVLRRGTEPGSLVSPPMIALLLVANLLPAIALMVLFSRGRDAGARRGRAGQRPPAHPPRRALGIAACRRCSSQSSPRSCSRAGSNSGSPTGLAECSKNAAAIAQSVYGQEEERVAAETQTMSSDVAGYLRHPIDDPRFADAFAKLQVYQRGLSEAIIFMVGPRGEIPTYALVNPYDRPLDKLITKDKIAALKSREVGNVNSRDRVGALTRLDYGPNAYIYAARVFDPAFRGQLDRQRCGERLSGCSRVPGSTSFASTQRCCSAR